ncbi:MAG TPA: hypothetical protein VFS82_11345 [Lysobacter sp.]|nr:hypothetical protein [Lysobacter sp.]
MTTTVTPTLPTAAIREALDADDLETAMGLISHHERDVRAALEKAGAAAHDYPGWQALLAEQRALLEQLQAARTDASDALQRLKGNRRSVQAYQTGSAR